MLSRRWCGLSLGVVVVAVASVFAQGPDARNEPAAGGVEAEPPLIQIALLLDTSGSMQGLIEQAKQHLWSVVNEFAATRRDGRAPQLQVALFEYGNDGLSGESGYIRMVQPLTGDLDAVSEGLFALSTNGGSEHCGQVIDAALKQLEWGDDPDAYRAIFIAGNEPFTQGPVNYEAACRDAIARGILVNTIHCGGYDEGVNGKWQHGAQLADGSYLVIDHNQALVHIDAPQDAELARLNEELNATFVWHGAAGEEAGARQAAQDANAAAAAPAVLAERVATKGTSFYGAARGDLVDEYKQNEGVLADLDEAELPEAMRGMDEAERAAYLREQADRRAEVQAQIRALSKAREAYLAEERRKLAESGEDTLGSAMVKAVREQLTEQGFERGE